MKSDKNNTLTHSRQYHTWVQDIKKRVRQAQLKAATFVNTALLEFYWNLGADIVEQQKQAVWGSGFLKQLSKDLTAEFPDMKGLFAEQSSIHKALVLLLLRFIAQLWNRLFHNYGAACLAIGSNSMGP